MPISCNICKAHISPRSDALKCHGKCGKWFHANCLNCGLDLIDYYMNESKKRDGDHWICNVCLPVSASEPREKTASLSLNELIKNILEKELARAFKEHFHICMQSFVDDIVNIKSQISKLDDAINNLSSNSQMDANIAAEMEERQQRSLNVMVYNVPESSGTIEEKIKKDLTAIKSATNIDFSPHKIIRLGKMSDKPRPIKLLFKDRESAITLLKASRTVDTGPIKFASDRTKLQRDHLFKVKQDLENRKANGEQNLTIKYVHGNPSIVSSAERKYPKN